MLFSFVLFFFGVVVLFVGFARRLLRVVAVLVAAVVVVGFCGFYRVLPCFHEFERV